MLQFSLNRAAPGVWVPAIAELLPSGIGIQPDDAYSWFGKGMDGKAVADYIATQQGSDSLIVELDQLEPTMRSLWARSTPQTQDWNAVSPGAQSDVPLTQRDRLTKPMRAAERQSLVDFGVLEEPTKEEIDAEFIASLSEPGTGL